MTKNHYWEKVLGKNKLFWLRMHGGKIELLFLLFIVLIMFFFKDEFHNLSFGMWVVFILIMAIAEINKILREDEFYNKGFRDGSDYQQEWHETGKQPKLE